MKFGLSSDWYPIPERGLPYDYDNPGPPFRPEDIAGIDMIKSFLSDSELAKARSVETVFFSRVFGSGMGTFISGLRPRETSFCFYICRYGDAYYEDIMMDFTDAVYEGLSEENPGAVSWGWYRATTPEGERFYPLERSNNLKAWKDRVIAVASELSVTLAWFDQGKFRMTDGRQWDFGQLQIDRLEGGRPIPRDW